MTILKELSKMISTSVSWCGRNIGVYEVRTKVLWR